MSCDQISVITSLCEVLKDLRISLYFFWYTCLIRLISDLRGIYNSHRNLEQCMRCPRNFKRVSENCLLARNFLIPFAFQEKLLVFFLNMNGHQKVKDLIVRKVVYAISFSFHLLNTKLDKLVHCALVGEVQCQLLCFILFRYSGT